MEIIRIVNVPVPSNTYILYEEGTGECIIVDPGSKDSNTLFKILDELQLQPSFVLLTHEHFDHIWGVNDLFEKYGVKVLCSQTCKEKISTPQNYFNRLYYNSDEFFSVDNVYKTIEELNFEIEIGNWQIRFVKTPGHSSSSICIETSQGLFTGDTLMNGVKPLILKRHEGSKSEFEKSIIHLFNAYHLNTMIYPGHGNPFILYEALPFYENYFGDSFTRACNKLNKK